MKKYSDLIKEIKNSENFKNSSWESINPEYVARMQLQNRFKSGIEIAKYNAAIMRKDMDEYDSDPSKYTQSLGCLLYTSPSPRDAQLSRMPSSA